MAADPFQPVLEILQRLEQEDPKLASQAARLLGLYRRMWQSCVSKHVDIQRFEDANQELRTNNVQLCHKADHLKHRQSDQLARLHFFEQALQAETSWHPEGVECDFSERSGVSSKIPKRPISWGKRNIFEVGLCSRNIPILHESICFLKPCTTGLVLLSEKT